MTMEIKEEFMNFESFEEIVNYAIEREKEASAFYAETAEMESFSGAKKQLEEMSAEEKKHQNLLENLGENREVLDGYKFKWIPDMKRSDYMVDLEYEQGMGYPDILRLAMKREEKALALYNDLLGKANTPEHERVFKMLCQEEAKHKLFLETQYDDYMAKMGD
jgi:rubrerythrin